MEFRPGVIPLRPLTLGDLYGALTRVIRGNPGATVGLALVTTIVFLLPFTALGAWVGSRADLSVLGGSVDSGGDEGAFFLGTIGSTYIPLIGTGLSTLVLAGFMAWIVGQAVIGRRVSAGQTWEGTRGRLLPLVGASLLTGLLTLLALGVLAVGPVLLLVRADGSGDAIGGAFLLILLALLVAAVGSLWIYTRLAFVAPVIVIERQGVLGGIRRSFRLTAGSTFWRVLGIRLLTGLLIGIAAQVLAFPITLITLGAVAAAGPENLLVVQAITSGLAGVVTGALTTPFTAGLDGLLYVDQRMRLEGYDVELVAATGGGVPPRR